MAAIFGLEFDEMFGGGEGVGDGSEHEGGEESRDCNKN
jgi:hypothetical protein